MEYTPLEIKEDFIKLDSAMKLAGITYTGGHAKFLIQNGEVLVNNEVCLQRGKKLHKNDTFSFENQGFIIVWKY